jgi:hypothetical protein
MSDTDPVSASDADRIEKRGKPRPKGKIPFLPDRSATFSELREWLSAAIGLPNEIRVDTVVRAGRDIEDPLTIALSNDMKMRCSHQKRLQQARTLQAFLASESDGIADAPYLSPAETGDVYKALCRLGTTAAKADPIDDLHERLMTFVGICREIRGSLARAARYLTIERIRAQRPRFDRSTALGRNGEPEARPIVLVDLDGAARYIRASEWLTYLRFVLGQTVDPSRLVAQMAELGSERMPIQAWNLDRSHKTHLVFYSLPEDL